MIKNRAFTLLELIVVIVILGILATLGYSQYNKVVEKMRGAEARATIGNIRQLAIAYRLQNGSITGMTDTDVNIGTSTDQIPSACRSTNYFRYWFQNQGDPVFCIVAYRCTSGGKNPQYGGSGSYLQMCGDLSTGVMGFGSDGGPW